MQKKSLAKAAVAIVAIVAAGAALGHSGASGIVKERMDAMSAIARTTVAAGLLVLAVLSLPALWAQPAAAAAERSGIRPVFSPLSGGWVLGLQGRFFIFQR